MGAVTAILFAEINDQSKYHLSSLVLDSPFTDLNSLAQDVASQQSSIPALFVSMAMSVVKSTIREKLHFDIDELNPLASIQRLSVPAVFHVGRFDMLVKPERVAKFYHTYPTNERLLIQTDCDHGGERSQSDFYTPCFRFVSDKFDSENFRKFVPASSLSANTALMKKALSSKANTNTGYMNDQYSRGTMKSKNIHSLPKPQLALAGATMKSVITGPTRPRNPTDATTTVSSFLAPESVMPPSSFSVKRKASGTSQVCIFEDEHQQATKQSSRSGGTDKITVGFPPQASATILSQTVQVKTNNRVVHTFLKEESTLDSHAASNPKPRTLYSDVSPTRSRQPEDNGARKRNPMIFDSVVPVFSQKPKDLTIPKTTNHINHLAQQYSTKSSIGRERMEEIKYSEHRKNQLLSDKSGFGQKDRSEYPFEASLKQTRRLQDTSSFITQVPRKIEPTGYVSNTKSSKSIFQETDFLAHKISNGYPQQSSTGDPHASNSDENYARTAAPQAAAYQMHDQPNRNHLPDQYLPQQAFEKETPPNNHSQSTEESIHKNSLTENPQQPHPDPSQPPGVVNVSRE